MTSFHDRFANMRPRILPRAGGGWLAASQDGAPIAIGVWGNTTEEARERFTAAVETWSALLLVSDSERTGDVSDTT